MSGSTKPIALSGPPAQLDSYLFEMWARIGILYKDALDASAYDLVMSSTRIVQEHTLRAMVSASHSCAQALANNAAKVQQQSVERMFTANRRAAEIMGQTWIEAVMPKTASAR
jgi:hypothetical protein